MAAEAAEEPFLHSKYQRPLEELCCVNPHCPDAGRRGAGNLTVRTGKGGGRWRILRCSSCKTEFSERRGTPLWGTRMDPEKAEAIASHLKEGCGIRKTSRLVGASKDGVRVGERISPAVVSSLRLGVALGFFYSSCGPAVRQGLHIEWSS